jgi:hypothetical protein
MGHANALGLGTATMTLTAGTLDPGDADRTITNAMRINHSSGYGNHTIAGTNNLTFSGGILGSDWNARLTSSLDAGKMLTVSNGIILSSNGSRNFILNGTGDTRISGVIADGSGSSTVYLENRGATTISGTNTYTGHTAIYGGGTVVLDYGAVGGDGNKLPDGANLALSGGPFASGKYGGTDLILKGGTHTEVVSATYVGGASSGRGHVNVSRQGGSATLQMNAITFNGETINFSEDDIATTDSVNYDQILRSSSGSPAVATVGGTDWAYNSGGADGLIRRLPAGSYTTLPANGGSITVNYVLNGSFTQTGLNDINTLKIVPTADGQTLRSAPTA